MLKFPHPTYAYRVPTLTSVFKAFREQQRNLPPVARSQCSDQELRQQPACWSHDLGHRGTNILNILQDVLHPLGGLVKGRLTSVWEYGILP